MLSAALAAQSLDVLAARIYGRRRPGRSEEAVDLFLVRRLRTCHNAPIDAKELVAIQGSMAGLLRGEVPIPRIERHPPNTSRPARTAVYFRDDDPELLLVETPDRPGILLAITLAIFRERFSIAHSNIATFAGTACDEFRLRELDGSRLTDGRKTAVVEKIRAALTEH